MLRPLGLAFLCITGGSAAAQLSGTQTLHPADGKLRRAAELDWSTGTWRPNPRFQTAEAGATQVIYNNTCTWTGGQRFVASETCWERYDDGRIPSTLDPFQPPGGLVCDCYLVTAFEIGYCTREAPGGVAVQIGFYEGLTVSGVGGFCTGYQTTGVPPSGNGVPKPPGNMFGPRDFFIDLTGVGLPADPDGGGTQTCWTVTVDLSNIGNGGFPFCGNGDVVFDNNGDLDLFNWVWMQEGTTKVFGPTGPLQAGEPIHAASGSGTFGINPGFDQVLQQPCGTGLGNSDNFWINVDGQPIGGGGNVGLCAVQPAGGSNCYFLNGWPFNPYAGLYLKMWSSSAACANGATGNIPLTYCTAKASSSGCLAEINGSSPLQQPVSGANDYDVVTTLIEGLKAGIFFYGISGPAAIPFNGGFLCVSPTGGLGRTPIKFSNGSLQNCDGTFSQRINGGLLFNMDMGPGTSNWVQTWYRDPALMDGFNTALSDAIHFTFQ